MLHYKSENWKNLAQKRPDYELDKVIGVKEAENGTSFEIQVRNGQSQRPERNENVLCSDQSTAEPAEPPSTHHLSVNMTAKETITADQLPL